MFTDTEQKLIRLALNEAAQPAEIRNSAVKLLESLRRRGVRPEVLILVMPFGKHRGQRLDAIKPSYLRWTLRECSCLSLGLKEAIRQVVQAL